MTLKELKEKYLVFKYGERYDVYDPDENSGKRVRHSYLCSLLKDGDTFIFNEVKYRYIEDLQKAIGAHIESLPYPSEYYDPKYCKGYLEDVVISDYMRELGFNTDGYLILKDIYGYESFKLYLTISGLAVHFRDEVPEKVDVSLVVGPYTIVSVTCNRNIPDIKASIDSLVKPNLLYQVHNLLALCDKMQDVKVDSELIEMDWSTLTIQKSKVELKDKLLSLIEKL
jgi:hypothetical protein